MTKNFYKIYQAQRELISIYEKIFNTEPNNLAATIKLMHLSDKLYAARTPTKQALIEIEKEFLKIPLKETENVKNFKYLLNQTIKLYDSY